MEKTVGRHAILRNEIKTNQLDQSNRPTNQPAAYYLKILVSKGAKWGKIFQIIIIIIIIKQKSLGLNKYFR